MCKIISIVNQKGGVAKTTTTNAFGIGLAKKGFKVLLIDLDPQGDLSKSFGVTFPDDEDNTIAALILDEIQQEHSLRLLDCIHSCFGIDFIVGNDDLDKLDKMMVAFRDSEYTLQTLLNPIKEFYDYIVIDCRPSMGVLTENAIVAADEIIVPSEPQFFSMKGIENLFEEISKIQRRKNPQLKIAGILPTKVEFQTTVAKQFMMLAQDVFGNQFHIFAPIPKSTKVSECNIGKNMYEYDKSGKGVLAYLAFVEEYLSL